MCKMSFKIKMIFKIENNQMIFKCYVTQQKAMDATKQQHYMSKAVSIGARPENPIFIIL